ncbi:prenyl protein peptidase [Tothia fuscella]|uniref:intramembrane prenyl-peptidase Rce1 n=1 Tax=Tothia fuscella TaxID=1048955 RepID=A0A9P4NMF2_9PEZI|nr:prenyl protein peptidase [Tothia fuscella]
MAPIDMLHKIKSFYTKEPMITASVITPRTAAALSVAFTTLYVLPFYLSKSTRPSPSVNRDAPSVIRARTRAVTSACILTTIIDILIINQYGKSTLLETVRLLGWWPIDVLAIGKTLLLCSILFIGPLFEAGIVEGGWRHWIRGTHVRETLSSWTGYRALVVGPVTEEIVFRSVLIPLHLLAKMSPSRIVFLSPLYFGIAHLHHLYEFRLTHPEIPLLPAVLRTVLQFTYTSLFGFFAAFVYLRTGSLYAAMAAHSFCNWNGFPRFWGKVGVQAGAPIGLGSVKRDEDRTVATPRRDASIAWTVAYYSLLVIGAYGFYVELFPLTESKYALAEFAKDVGKGKRGFWG